ncbi:uncharacterized protein LOC135497849 isoform X2 [Lineus longissimus]|uniref:uncharacterized protein LOC135497849 isoform X2 n=1 Tax=Lineus longissimus TaxID=88925 RepID=UPI00315D148D
MAIFMLFVFLVLASAECLQFSGNSYRFYPGPSTWKDATSVCLSTNGSLLNFKTAAEQDFIEGILKKQNVKEVWTAGHFANAFWHWSRNLWGLKGQGCYDDDCGVCYFDRHDLDAAQAPSQSFMSVEFCTTFCRKKKYDYCGLQSGSICYCGGNGATFGKRGPASGCNQPCFNNAAYMCGGAAKNSIYSTRENAYSAWWNYHPESTRKQCAAMTSEHEYQWLEDNCFTQKAYICQQDMLNVSDVCRFQALSYQFCVSISKPGETANWFQAREKCSTLGPDVDLATLDQKHKQRAMKDYLAKTLGIAKDFWIGATRNQLLWNLDGKMHKYSKVYVSRFDSSSTFAERGNLLFYETKDGYRLKDANDDEKATAGFVCQNDLPTTTASPATTSTVSPRAIVTSDQPFIPTTVETTPTTTTTIATTEATEASTTSLGSGSGNAMGQGGGTAADDHVMLAVYVACGGGVLLIVLVTIAIVIAKKKRKPPAEKIFKVNYAPSIQDLNRRSTNIVDGSVTIQAAESNIYTDPATIMQSGVQGALYDNTDDHKREQVTNKARMRAIKEGMYDVPKPRLSAIPAAPEPSGIDDRKPAPLPACQAIKMDELNKGVDSTKDTQPIYAMEDNSTEYSYAYGGFMGPSEPEAGNVSGGNTSYEKLVN